MYHALDDRAIGNRTGELHLGNTTMASPNDTAYNICDVMVAATHVDADTVLQNTITNYNLTDSPENMTIDLENVTMSSATQGMHIFRAFFSPVIILLGIIGNSLSIAIFFHYRKWDQASIHYLAYLAVSDTGNLIFNGIVEWLNIGLRYATDGQFFIDIPATNRPICIVVRYVWLHFAFLSSWILVLFTVERFLVVWFPLRAMKWVTVTKRRRLLILLTFVSALSLFPVPVIYDVYKKNGFSVCLPNSRNSHWMSTYFAVHSMVTTNFLPCILLTLFNVLIIIGIVRSGQGRRKLGTGSSRRQEVMIAINLLFVSTVYLILTVPLCLSWGLWFIWEYNRFQGMTVAEIRTALEVNRFITSVSIISYSVNFCIYTARLTFFKRRVAYLFSCGQYTKLESTSQQNEGNSSRTKSDRKKGPKR